MGADAPRDLLGWFDQLPDPRVVIIGAACVLTDGLFQDPSTPWSLARFIDRSDTVVRMNNLKNLGSPGLGRKTDILAASNTGRPGRRYAELARLDHPMIASVPEIWFGTDPALIRSGELLSPEGCLDPDGGQDWSPEILDFQRWRDRDWHHIPAEVTRQVRDELVAMGASTPDPSTGVRVIFNVLAEPRFADHSVFLLGFGFRGWRGHCFDAERRLVTELATSGRIGRAPGSLGGRLFPHRVSAILGREIWCRFRSGAAQRLGHR